MLGKIEGKRRKGQQSIRWLDSITDSMDISQNKLPEIMKDMEAWCAAVREIAELHMTQQLKNNITKLLNMPIEKLYVNMGFPGGSDSKE